MAWTDIRSAIKTVLEGISITTPSASSIAKVHETPPATVQDLPCFIIFPPACDVTGRGAGGRRKDYTVRCLLLVRDADLPVAADLADSFREATIDAFDADVKLGVVPHGNLDGQRMTEAASFEYPRGGGKFYTGFECFLEVFVQEPRTFTA